MYVDSKPAPLSEKQFSYSDQVWVIVTKSFPNATPILRSGLNA
jgi:hypothetical protein